MPRVVVAGSDNELSFAVIDFTNPAAPSVVPVNPGFGAGCRVILDGHTCYAGSSLTGEIRIVDVSNPAAPVQQGSLNTVLAGVGALAVQGTLLAIGEWINSYSARVALIDVSNPAAPTLLGTAPTTLASTSVPGPDGPQGTPAVGSLAFIAPHVVVVAGPSDPQIVRIDFSNPAAPVVTHFLSGFAAVSMDADTTRILAGDATGPQVKLFDSATNTAIAGPIGTTVPGISGVAMAYPLALAGSTNDGRAARITFSGATATTDFFTPTAGGGYTTAIDGTLGVCGDQNGTNVALVNLGTSPPATMGVANSGLASIGTLSLKTFTGGGGGGPIFGVTPTSLAFGVVRVGSMSPPLSFTVHDTGGATLNITNLAAPARYTLNPPATSFGVAAGSSHTVGVTFAPNAEMPFNGSITMHSDDPAHPSPSVAVTGSGGLPHINVSTAPINLGSTPICEPTSATVTIQNTGAYQLTVSSLATSGSPFSVTPASLAVPGNATRTATVHFSPTATGAVTGTLTIASDDANQPSITIQLSGTGLPEPPPDINATPNPMHMGACAVNFFIGRRLVVTNTGPCEDLVLTIDCSGAPFFVTTGDPTSVPTANTPLHDTIPAGMTRRYAVIFAPTALGAANGMLTITSNAGSAPMLQVPLDGNGVAISPASIELVLDRSGSMAGGAPGGVTKMDALHQAVRLLAELTPTNQGEAMGSVQFDDAVAVLTPFGNYDDAQRTAIEAGADSLTPRNMTSIGGGIHLARGELAAATNRKVMLVFTDGMENTAPMIATELPGVLADGIEAYAVGLGQPQNISSGALSQLAANSGGRYFQTDDTLILRKQFVEVLVDAFRQNMAVDPILTLGAGQTLEFPVRITDCESRIGFVLNWDDPASVVDLAIVSPGGTVYTPSAPAGNQLVRYGAYPGYRFYQIAFPPIDPGSGQAIGPDRIGTWLMRLTGKALTGATERCTTSVFVESDLNLRTSVNAATVGSPMSVSARLTHAGMPITNAKLVATVVSPTTSLAAVQTPQVMAAALAADHHPFPTNRRPVIGSRTTRVRMAYVDKRRGYVAALPTPKIDGVYQVVVEGIGRACGGVFQRYSSQSVHVGRRGDKLRQG